MSVNCYRCGYIMEPIDDQDADVMARLVGEGRRFICDVCHENSDADTRSMPYDMYLRTETWRVRRRARLALAQGRCEVCNARGDLDVHHRTYDRRGDERIEDLIVLCRSCHATFHGKAA